MSPKICHETASAEETGGGAADFRLLVHALNQRYRREFDRAERLQAELENIKGSRAWRLLCWWCGLKSWLRSTSWFVKPRAAQPAPWSDVQSLEHCRVAPRGCVSIVICFKNHPELLRNCLRRLLISTWKRFEIILIDNGSTCLETKRLLARLRGRRRIHILHRPGPFNFSQLCNDGARQARDRFLLFLNNDVEVLSPDWLQEMTALGGHPRIGVVGATLLYPDGTLQHAGIFPNGHGTWSHASRGRPADHAGELGELQVARSVPAVTGACLLIRRKLFQELGGFDEALPLTGNDVDLCTRARQRGLLVAITPHARLLHFESLGRGYSAE